MIDVESDKILVKKIQSEQWIGHVLKDKNFENFFATPHWNRTLYVGKTSPFFVGDWEEAFEKNKLNKKKLSKLKEFGWLDQTIDYHIDVNGFRTDNSIKDYNDYAKGDNVIYAGCSHVFGTGVNLEDTWSYKLHKQIHPEKNYVNISTPGSGIETIYRYLRYWIPRLKPSHVYIQNLWPSTRGEIWQPIRQDFDLFLSSYAPSRDYLLEKEKLLTEDDFHNELQTMTWFFVNKYYPEKSAPNIDYTESINFSVNVCYDPQPSLMRLIKNLDALKYVFWKYKVKGYMFPMLDAVRNLENNIFTMVDNARDLWHPGKITHTKWKNYYANLIDNYKEFDYYNTSETWHD